MFAAFGYKPRSQANGSRRTAAVGNRLTVDPRTLTPLVLVRIQVPQPNIFPDKVSVSVLANRILENNRCTCAAHSPAQYHLALFWIKSGRLINRKQLGLIA